MVYAILVTYKFKPGMREKAMETVDDLSAEGKNTKGFKGLFALYPVDDPNAAFILSLWDSEESLDAAREGIIKNIWGKLGDMVAEPISGRKLKAREMAAQLIPLPA